MAAVEDCVGFFEGTTISSYCVEAIERMKEFAGRHLLAKRKIVLVTSGGTTVPLESRTVRFIDNFSIGSRGSISTEYFLELGYVVIFLHRRGSLEPYRRHFQHKNWLDMLHLHEGQICVKDEHTQLFSGLLSKYTGAKETGTMLSVEFTTLNEYLYLLRGAAQSLSHCKRTAALYLAAAVSDFYIPSCNMPDHKIQSTDGPLQLSLQLVPKMLRPLVHEWCPQAYVISFKLETNPEILLHKARHALESYHHQAVIGNILETRKKEVVIVTPSDEKWITLTEAQLDQPGQEIEKLIVAEIDQRHAAHMKIC